MPLFRRPPRPATPPGTPIWRPDQSPASVPRSLPARIAASLTEPETLLAVASAANLAFFASAFAPLPWVAPSESFGPLLGLLFKILQVGSWAATIGVGISSPFRAFRFMGRLTAVGAAGLYLWMRLSRLPLWHFFGIGSLLIIATHVGNLIAWLLARRRSDGA